jgi:hypothetical protein
MCQRRSEGGGRILHAGMPHPPPSRIIIPPHPPAQAANEKRLNCLLSQPQLFARKRANPNQLALSFIYQLFQLMHRETPNLGHLFGTFSVWWRLRSTA